MLKLDKYILRLEQIYFPIWTNCKNSSSFLWPCAFCPAVCSNQFTHQLQSVRIEGWLTNTKNTQNPNYKNLKHTKEQEYTKFKSTKVQTGISDKFSHKLQSIGLKEDEVRWYNDLLCYVILYYRYVVSFYCSCISLCCVYLTAHR